MLYTRENSYLTVNVNYDKIALDFEVSTVLSIKAFSTLQLTGGHPMELQPHRA